MLTTITITHPDGTVTQERAFCVSPGTLDAFRGTSAWYNFDANRNTYDQGSAFYPDDEWCEARGIDPACDVSCYMRLSEVLPCL